MDKLGVPVTGDVEGIFESRSLLICSPIHYYLYLSSGGSCRSCLISAWLAMPCQCGVLEVRLTALGVVVLVAHHTSL